MHMLGKGELRKGYHFSTEMHGCFQSPLVLIWVSTVQDCADLSTSPLSMPLERQWAGVDGVKEVRRTSSLSSQLLLWNFRRLAGEERRGEHGSTHAFPPKLLSRPFNVWL